MSFGVLENMLSNVIPLVRLFGLALFGLFCLCGSVKAQVPSEILDMEGIPKIPGVTAPAEGEKKIVKTHVTPFFVKGWIAVAANEIFAFNASNYSERRDENIKLFTETGAKSFYRGIENNFINVIRQKDQDVRGYIVSPILLLDPQEDGSDIYWEASFDYVMEYTSKSGGGDASGVGGGDTGGRSGVTAGITRFNSGNERYSRTEGRKDGTDYHAGIPGFAVHRAAESTGLVCPATSTSTAVDST